MTILQEKVSPKFCIGLAIILLQLQWQTVLAAVFDYAINVCENVSDYIFVQNIEDCSRYFVCIDGQAIAQQCRTGLNFDANRQACVATRNVCLQCPKHKKVNLPLLKTCDKYVSCYYGNIYLRKCEYQQQFNRITGKCDAAKNVDCVDNRCSIHVLDNNATYVTSAAKCEKYFMCQEGKMKALSCGKGLYFSTKCNCCDLKDNVECLIEENPETKLTNVKEKRISQESLMEKLHLPTILSNNVNIKCPTTGSFIYPYHGNSDYYYTCINGQASLRACAEGYQYNVTQRRCIKPKLEEDNDMADFELKVPVEEVELFEVNCPLEGATIMAHSESKEKYILCMNGQPTVFDCAEGLFYNDKLKKCSEYVGEIAIYQAALPGETNNLMCPKFGTFKYPHANDTHYYLCTDGKVYILACEKDEIFDSDINICRERSETDMKRTETVTNDENITDKPRATIVAEFASNIICPKLGTFMFPHSQRNRYYVCIDGHAIGFACADGYIYDSEVNACKLDSQTLQAEAPAPTLLDEQVNILCPSSGASKFPHLARNKFYLCINGMASVLACPQGTLFDAELSNCRTHLEQEQEDDDSKLHTTSEVTVTCPKLGTFVYAHINKTQYNVCLDGQSIVLTCNEGLIFDPKEKICRTPNENNVENIKALVDLKADPSEILNTVEGKNNSSVELKGIPTENVEATGTHTTDVTEVNKSMETERINKIVQKGLKVIPAEHIQTLDTLEVSKTSEADSLDSSDGDNNSEILKLLNEVLYAIKHNSNDIATTDEVDKNIKALIDLKATQTEIVNTSEGGNNSSVELKAIPTEYIEATGTYTPDETEVNKSMEIESSDINKIAQNSKVKDLEALVDLKAITAEHVETVDTLEVSKTLEADSLDSDGDNNSEILKQHNKVLYAIEHNSNDITTTDEVDKNIKALIDLKATPTDIVNTAEGGINSSVELKAIPTEYIEATETHTPDETERNKPMEIGSSDFNRIAQNSKVKDLEALAEADSLDSDGDNNSEILKQHNKVLYAIKHNSNDIAITDEVDKNIKALVDLKAIITDIVNTAEGGNNSSIELKAIPTEHIEATETYTPDETEVNKSMDIESSDINKIAQNSKVKGLEALVDLKAIPAEHVGTVDTLEVSKTLESDSLDSDGDNSSEILKQHNKVLYAIDHNSNDIMTTDEVDKNIKALVDLKATPTDIVNTAEGDNNSSVELKAIPTEYIEATETHTPDETERNKPMEIGSSDINRIAQNSKVKDLEALVEADSLDSDGDNKSEIHKQHNEVLYGIEHNINDIATTDEVNQSAVAENI